MSNVTVSLIDIEASEVIGWSMKVLSNSVNYLNCDGRSTMSGALTGGGTLNVFTPYVRTISAATGRPSPARSMRPAAISAKIIPPVILTRNSAS